MRVVEMSPAIWKQYSESAHKIVFNEIKSSELDRIDFALVAEYNDDPAAYVTCREHDKDTVYWQFGGSFPNLKDTALSWRAYSMGIDHCFKKYKRIVTLIENTNTVMLKMAMKAGFKIVGIRFFKGSVLLEHLLEA